MVQRADLPCSDLLSLTYVRDILVKHKIVLFQLNNLLYHPIRDAWWSSYEGDRSFIITTIFFTIEVK